MVVGCRSDAHADPAGVLGPQGTAGFECSKEPGMSEKRARRIGRRHHWWVVLPLWMREDRMSDPSLEATVTESPGGIVVVIDGIHVL